MRAALRTARFWAVAGASTFIATSALAQESIVGIPVAEFAWVEGQVEVAGPSGDWAAVATGGSLRTADRLRTGPRSMARLSFPWMSIALSAESVLSTPGERVLRVNFEDGRMEIDAEEAIIKIQTAEAEVRGRGRAVVRRDAGVTIVTALSGTVTVEGSGSVVTLETNQGTIVQAGTAPTAPRSAPSAPHVRDPAQDPRYVRLGQPLELSWEPEGGRHHVQILGVDSDAVLLEMDVEGTPHSLQLPWIGTYRWRVARVDAEGLESRASGEGLICVVDD